MRWRRFWGLLFAPVFAVMRGFMRPRNGFEPAPKPHRGGAACALPPPSHAQRPQTPTVSATSGTSPTPTWMPASPPPALRNHRWFRYRFESIQARKTVRWRRFWGLLFAPVFAVMRGFMRPRAGFEPALKPHRSGAACALPPPSHAQRPQTPDAARLEMAVSRCLCAGDSPLRFGRWGWRRQFSESAGHQSKGDTCVC